MKLSTPKMALVHPARGKSDVSTWGGICGGPDRSDREGGEGSGEGVMSHLEGGIGVVRSRSCRLSVYMVLLLLAPSAFLTLATYLSPAVLGS
jgi:hypothetical protein